ncbi:hypothetical protein [Raineyella sp. W15-4]|uniref:hypothetical protein n=1 Tax=Raineyella sp. W15-4 TaxID=3081651 RepID=UPI0029547486|nr:hypothetical protein [Raineyella sp. W15-4]WOQ18575.1 hypothetical protein R0145_07895 [Raineyella sp. W15-4]
MLDWDHNAYYQQLLLRQLPLGVVLPRLADALRPGGVLAAVALPRRDLRHEWPLELAAAVGHRVLGVGFLVGRALGTGHGHPKEPGHRGMPVVLDPPLSTPEVSRVASTVLPGVHVKRLLFWRYLLIGKKPPGGGPHSKSES